MDVQELAPGLWRWTAYHEQWKKEVGSVYLESDDEIVLIDPLVPREEIDRFWAALDRDIGAAGKLVHVLITVFFHTRSAGEIVERYAATLWVEKRSRRRIASRGGEPATEFELGDALPAAIEAFPAGRSDELVYWLP